MRPASAGFFLRQRKELAARVDIQLAVHGVAVALLRAQGDMHQFGDFAARIALEDQLSQTAFLPGARVKRMRRQQRADECGQPFAADAAAVDRG